MTRGERNHNPMNIRRDGTKWQGLSYPQTDPDFCTFVTNIDGIRAGAKVLLAYYNVHGLKTVACIINRYAPPVENITRAYVQDVCECLDVSDNEAIDLTDQDVLSDLVKAIIRHENGRCIYADDVIIAAVRRALGKV